MRFSSSTMNCAARRTSSLCCGSVLTLGMRSSSFSSLRNLCWLALSWVNATAEETAEVDIRDLGILGRNYDREKYTRLNEETTERVTASHLGRRMLQCT